MAKTIAPIPKKPDSETPKLDMNRGYQENFYAGKAGKVKYIQDGHEFAADKSYIGREKSN